ncbi:Ada metal-binding domain-containing protein [Tabrizicola sp.]|uniref:Ada metal-binding domain-containing protein n=1 Tax=Tabrizicola sp. TaxID=2005166 RepID=UPI002734048B|nr:Ada metal-binding domain-containing protein [Tabrizicola sp.]MDP3195222.1 Ada metal-binding domain-containing protein [Tabrizicola sp.]MDZ4087012.1 Ada metal-binding domain-containing protein [Tabrizicola sp.]
MQPDADAIYDSLAARDGRFGGQFVCVKTTGIFCRMTCPARTPLRQNVEFRGSVEACLAAGFRACKRCRPYAGLPGAGRSSVTGS